MVSSIKNRKYYSLQKSVSNKNKKSKNLSLPIKLVGQTLKFKKSVKRVKRVKNVKSAEKYKSIVKKSVSKMQSLPTKLVGQTPKFKPMTYDQVFWKDYKKGADIHSYVEKRIHELKLTMSPIPKEKGVLCKMDKSNLKLFPYQIVSTVLGSPYSPLSKLLIIASTGTGKSCILVGIANYHVIQEKKHGIIFVGATEALYTNFIKQSLECPGHMKQLAAKHGWIDSKNTEHVHEFTKFMKKYIYPVDYTQFANMLSGKYKKYQGVELSTLKGKVVLFDEVHYLVDSISQTTFKPTYERMPNNWQTNLRQMYNLLSTPDNPYLEGSIIVGATATPITQSIMEYFALVNMFAIKPFSKDELKSILQNVNKIEQGLLPDSTLNKCIDKFKPIIRDSVTVYNAKTSKKVLDTSLFPQMQFENINVPLTSEQQRLIYTPKNYIMYNINK
jgi:Type III restriction enzyme, res subunit